MENEEANLSVDFQRIVSGGIEYPAMAQWRIYQQRNMAVQGVGVRFPEPQPQRSSIRRTTL